MERIEKNLRKLYKMVEIKENPSIIELEKDVMRRRAG